MAKLKILSLISIAALAIFAFMGAELFSAKASVKSLTTDINQLHANVATKQAEIDTLALSVSNASALVETIKNERTLVVELHQKQLAQQRFIAEQLAENHSQVNQLRQSNDEYVKAWSANHMPGAAVRLYPYAEYTGNYPDGGATSAGVSNASGKFAARLSTRQTF